MRIYPIKYSEVECVKLYDDITEAKKNKEVKDYIEAYKSICKAVRKTIEMDNLISLCRHREEKNKVMIIVFDKKAEADDYYPIKRDENNNIYIEVEG